MDIHESARRFQNVLDKLDRCSLTIGDKENLHGFVEALRVEGISHARITKYLYSLMTLATILKMEFASASKKDIQRVVLAVEASDYAAPTKRDFKITLKKFYKWLRIGDGEGNFPEEVRWIKAGMKRSDDKLPEVLLTEDEVKRLADAAQNSRDRALILVLYESGCRVGEILGLRLKHVQFDEYGAVLIVDGKTGMRRVRIIASAPTLSQWLQDHPSKDDQEAFLWIGLWNENFGERLAYPALRVQLKKLGRKVGIQKRIYPHLFRHSRASHLAKVLTEAQMKQHFGWVQSSDMAATYVHLSGRDVDQALLKASGVKVDGDMEELKFTVQQCPRCKENNSPSSRFCMRCGAPLTVRTALEVEEARNLADGVMDRLFDDPQVLALLREKAIQE